MCALVGMGEGLSVALLSEVVRVGLSEKVTFDIRHEGSRGVSQGNQRAPGSEQPRQSCRWSLAPAGSCPAHSGTQHAVPRPLPSACDTITARLPTSLPLSGLNAMTPSEANPFPLLSLLCIKRCDLYHWSCLDSCSSASPCFYSNSSSSSRLPPVPSRASFGPSCATLSP